MHSELPPRPFLPMRSSRASRLLVAGILAAAVALVALTWVGTLLAVRAEREQTGLRVAADAANQALSFSYEIDRQLLALDQSLRVLESEWEAAPDRFDLGAWRQRLPMLGGLVLQLFVTDAGGRIVASSRADLIGVDVAQEDYFRAQVVPGHDGGATFVGPVVRSPRAEHWQINMSRRLDTGGRFGGIVGLSYVPASIERFFAQADLGPNALVALVGADGIARAMVGPRVAGPGISLAGTDLFTAMRAQGSGRWSGPAPPDGVDRIVAFRAIPNRDLFVVVGLEAAGAMRSASIWAGEAEVFGSAISVLIGLMAFGMLRELKRARRRERSLDRDRSVLAAANAELAAARARADQKSALLETTIGGMSDGLAVLDDALLLADWNQRFVECLAAPAAALRLGMPFAELIGAQLEARGLPASDTARELERQLAPLRPDAPARTAELARHDGRTIELRHRALPDGGFVTLAADITARKEIELALDRARLAAEQAMDAKSRFVAIVSHEIRTPLNSLIGSLSLLAETKLDAEQGDLLRIAQQAGDALLGLINDVLEMTTIEAGRLSLRSSLFALRPLLDGVTEMFRPLAAGRSIALRLEVDAAVPALLHADPGRLRQVLMNLVSNAAKFSQPGDVVLHAGLARLGDREAVRLSVRDPGPVIGPADRLQLFQPFSRLTPAAPGSGLGLSICHGLMLLMGGQIGCEPTAEAGNEFWVMLPTDGAAEAVLALPAPAGATLAPAPAPPAFCRILLAEDVGASQVVLAALLRRQGYAVDVVGTGTEAVRLVQERPYDIVFLDLIMPGMTGPEAAAAIRALPGHARTLPIVALTASALEDDRARCLAAGMDDLIGKPATLPALLDGIARNMPAVARSQPPPTRSSTPGDSPSPLAAQALSPLAAPVPSPLAAPVPSPLAAPVPAPAALDADRLGHLRANLAPAVLARLAEEGLDDLRARHLLLLAAIAAADAGEIEAVAHAMLSIAGGCGFAALDARLRRIVAAARNGDAAACAAAAGGMSAEIEAAAQAISAALRTRAA